MQVESFVIHTIIDIALVCFAGQLYVVYFFLF